MQLENLSKFDEKAYEILGKLTLNEKVSLMSGNYTYEQLAGPLKEDPYKNHYNVFPYAAGGLAKYNLPPMLFADGPRGVVCGLGESTCFPVSMLRGATFNPELEQKIGEAIGKEIRSYDGNLFGGVCINLPYHPGWGRSQETYGEESFHIGQMGAALTKGVQSEDVIACVKHFAFNQMENSRFDVSVTCDQRTEREVFLPHFKDCIDAGAKSIMSSYNRYNGTYCGEHNYLLNEVLKGEWDFDGFVMSDFVWGMHDTVLAANSGQDIEMCLTILFGDNLVKAVEDGFVPEQKINESAFRIIRTMLAISNSPLKYDKSVLACNEHVSLAKSAALEGITLVKNEHNHLPLADIKQKIVIVGKLANALNIGDYGSSQVFPPYVVTIAEAFKNNNANSDIVIIDGDNAEELDLHIQDADEIITVVGYNHDDEGEYVSKEQHDNYLGAKGGDRFSLDLHTEDIELIKTIGSVNENQTVITIGGNTILMTEWIDYTKSIIMAFYPGMEGGNAVYEIIFGEVNPSGKLPFVVPFSEDDLPTVKWETHDQYYEYYHGYTRLEKNNVEPLFHYGHGLSYTTFDLDYKSLEHKDNSIIINVDVTNTGARVGSEVIQVYAGFENSKIDRPTKILRAFKKESIEPGETKTVQLVVDKDKLNWYNPVSREWEFEDIIYNFHVGTSASNRGLSTKSIYIN